LTQDIVIPNVWQSAPYPSAIIQAKDLSVRACFTPSQACLPMIIDEIDNAKSSIHMQAYSFTSKPIADALLRAKRRNVSIVVIADKSQKHERYTQIKAIKQSGIPIYIDHKPAISHSKILLIDNETVIGGSYNYSNAAEKRNAENVTFIKSKDLSNQYLSNFKNRLKESTAYDETT
jgi:phosphatidylserine/phosphatidylglycerophosphate/cardiolipin synthase-like enzyme